MKVFAVIVALATCVGFCHQEALECYSCAKTCNDPQDKQTCPPSKIIDYECISIKLVAGDKLDEVKGCARAGDIALKENCDRINEIGGSCFICDTDLCNVDKPVTQSVSKCYYCSQTCEDPLEEKVCPNSDVIEYRCMSSRIEVGTLLYFKYDFE
jgi:hypothetical protein